MIQVAHFSDLHYCQKNLAESDRCFGAAIDEAIRRNVTVAVISGDSTEHALDVHSPAVGRLAGQVRRLADHCPVLMLQGTFSHEPPGTLAVFPMLGGRYPVHVAHRISQVALTPDGRFVESPGWRFESAPPGSSALFTCIPTVNKAVLAATVGAAGAAEALGQELACVLAGFAAINESARAAGIATVGVSHGTVTGCVTEHGVPMAGFDHEFTSGALFAARAQAFLLGHIHRHQQWEQDGRLIAYAGSIGRFHHGESGAKGFLVWDVDASTATLQLIPTPARRTVDLVFEGKPDLAAINAAGASGQLDGAFVRVRWAVAEEDRHEVDRAALKRALATAADVQLEGRIIPVQRSRSEGISRCSNLIDKVRAWAHLTGIEPGPLVARLDELALEAPPTLADRILSGRMTGGLAVAASATSKCAAPPPSALQELF